MSRRNSDSDSDTDPDRAAKLLVQSFPKHRPLWVMSRFDCRDGTASRNRLGGKQADVPAPASNPRHHDPVARSLSSRHVITTGDCESRPCSVPPTPPSGLPLRDATGADPDPGGAGAGGGRHAGHGVVRVPGARRAAARLVAVGAGVGAGRARADRRRVSGAPAGAAAPLPPTRWRFWIGALLAVAGIALWAASVLTLMRGWVEGFDQAWAGWLTATVLLAVGCDLAWGIWPPPSERLWTRGPLLLALALLTVAAICRLGNIATFPGEARDIADRGSAGRQLRPGVPQRVPPAVGISQQHLARGGGHLALRFDADGGAHSVRRRQRAHSCCRSSPGYA
mgnify:CR=1 FL=1